jgi:catechol 2,3-dioxygenase-like lactoylglutathione lyase family enzyme
LAASVEQSDLALTAEADDPEGPDSGGTVAAMIQHVALETARTDERAALAFWRLLGFEPVDPPPSLRHRAAWLQGGRTQVHLLWSGDPVTPPQGHTAVVVDDYDATVSRLRAAGYDVEPRREHWGAARSFVRAPGGHRVEIMAAPPPTPC